MMHAHNALPDIVLEEIDKPSRTALLPAILKVWEGSVRASHTFLTENDIAKIKPFVMSAVSAIETLVIVRAHAPIGFIGMERKKIEMLFLHPSQFRRGIGSALVRYAIEQHGIEAVDCNEQNPKALAFYEHMGFTVTSRTPTDDMGNPFPILSLRLA